MAWAVSIIGTNVVAVLQIRRAVGLRPFGRRYLIACAAPAACFGAVGLAARAVAGDHLVVVVAAAVIGTAVYLPLLFRFRAQLLLTELAASMRPRARSRASAQRT